MLNNRPLISDTSLTHDNKVRPISFVAVNITNTV